MSTPDRSSKERLFFDRFFSAGPKEIDAEAIRREWQALKPSYRVENRRLPLPVWARRSLTDTGEQAWVALGQDVPPIDPHKAYCVYVHIPFCADRCGFCDCYSFPLKRHHDKQVNRYLALLTQEIHLWSQLGSLSKRPVSTVHFGGGTPTFLGKEPFAQLVDRLRAHLCTQPETEWAIESTSSELDTGMCAQLAALGFTRLHVGVQSLQDEVREKIGRREPAKTVLSKIADAVGKGWIVSVDLILGLPGQTLDGAWNDIVALEAAGIDGFSLYELQLSSRNRSFAEQHGLPKQERLANYFLLQASSRHLASLGYRKTLFNHFARARDTNLYFTFPERGEDCLALGAIADGVFGDYHYRHPPYRLYRDGVGPDSPGLQGGLRRNEMENHLRPLETALLSGRMSTSLFADVLGRDASERLFRQWRASALVENHIEPSHLRLTANGSWFVGQMMEQLATSAPFGFQPANA